MSAPPETFVQIPQQNQQALPPYSQPQQQQYVNNQQTLPQGAQIVTIPSAMNAPPQSTVNPRDRKKKKSHLAFSIIAGFLILVGSGLVWAGGFVKEDASAYISFYLVLFQVFVSVPAILTIISSFKDVSSLSLTITALIFSGISMLAMFIAGSVIASECHSNSYYYYGYYSYYFSNNNSNECLSDTLAAVGLFVVLAAEIIVVVIASLETKRTYTPAPAYQQTQVVVMQNGQQMMQPMYAMQPMQVQPTVYIQTI